MRSARLSEPNWEVTRCPTCGIAEPLDDYFPDCIKFDETFPDRVTGVPGDCRYVCKAGRWIDESQVGEWLPDNPEAVARKAISPREMYEAYINADDMKNFYNRKLGKPYQDPSQIPVTLEHLNACADVGMAAGVVWKKRARDTLMGIEQMGAFNVAIVKERLPDGRQAVIHVEEIYDLDPFMRCSTLMNEYGVRVCVVESLLCDIAWARAHGTATFIMPDPVNTSEERRTVAAKELGAPGLAEHIVAIMQQRAHGRPHVRQLHLLPDGA